MANFNLLFLGVLLVSAGGSVGLIAILLFQHEFTVQRRPSFILGYVLFIVALGALGNGGIVALVLNQAMVGIF